MLLEGKSVAVSTSQSRMPLLRAAIGKSVRVVQLDTQPQFTHQLIQLGLSPGDCIRVLRRAPLGGPLLIECNGRQVALGRRITAQIIVEETPCDSH